ncbi:MAG: O-antigen ligase family protein, partial [Chloroflexota bacterium]|nr:O-antigen ligase family protein [Chloroflexota bacterium]
TGNRNYQNQAAGYRTFYAPQQQTATGTAEQWVRVHHAQSDEQLHTVRLEVWRSWDQKPLRAVAVDVLPPIPLPNWPGILGLLVGTWCAVLAMYQQVPIVWTRRIVLARLPMWLARLLQQGWAKSSAPFVAMGGLLMVGVGVRIGQWPVTLMGLALLAWAALQRPALWLAALLFGLPFYYTFPLPILPGRSLNLVDVGILGAIPVLCFHWLLSNPTQNKRADLSRPTTRRSPSLFLWLLITSWALVATFAADDLGVALREWRVVFLNATLFALLLHWMAQRSDNRDADRWLLVSAWIAGGTVVALVGLWQYASGQMVIAAEGVWRVRAFYGSPNNLALYLERTLAVTLALGLFTRAGWAQRGWRIMAAVQAVALLLTFSKGALLLGLPALFATLWAGGFILLTQRNASRRLLWWIAGAGVLAFLAITPFLDTERFQRLLDFRQGTGFLRLQLWQSAWQMALDYPLLGVGPDNFLYHFRSHYILPGAWQEPNLNHPHNWVLDWWTRLGLPGLTLALLFFTTLITRLWRGLSKSAQPAVTLGVLAAVVAGLAHGLIDASYALPDLMIVWVLLAQFVGSAEHDARK